MPQFRSKPVVIEAEQYKGSNAERGVCVCRGQRPHLHTMHADQMVFLATGDWIVPEPDGEHFYPIKPDVFANKYEPT